MYNERSREIARTKMATPWQKKAETSKEKLEEIEQFCGQFGCTVKTIIKKILVYINRLPDILTSSIDKLYIFIVELTTKKGAELFVALIRIVGHILQLVSLVVPPVGIAYHYVSLVAEVLKVGLLIVDVKESLKPTCKLSKNDEIVHELAGLAKKLESTEDFINEIDVQEHIDEPTLQGLISNVDVHIAVDQLGNLKSRIISSMAGKKNPRMCLDFLILFVRISTLRHSLLFRFATCLNLKNYSLGTNIALNKCIEKEILSNQTFLNFFSLPSLENAAVLTVFDPSDGNVDELVTYLEELRIPLQDLKKELDDKIFLIKPFKNPSIYLGRPFPSFRSLRAMKDSTNHSNVRIRLKFTAVKEKFNEFYIQSPDLGEYMYMKENTYCKYEKMSITPTDATYIWRVIRVRETEKDEVPSCFMFCNKKWPEKIVYMEKTFFECARGKDTTEIDEECLFTLIPPKKPPIKMPVPCPGKVAVTKDHLEMESGQTPNKGKLILTDEICIPALGTINAFLANHDIDTGYDIEQIETHLLKDENDTMHHSVKKIAETLTYLDKKKMNEHTMQGLLKIISINFQLFQKTFPYDSILRKLLRVCGLILSCVWQTSDIERFVCSQINTGYSSESAVARDVRDLVRFTSLLREIEQANNIFQSNITEMGHEGKFCEELPCLANLKKHAKSQSCIMVTSVKVSILQLSVLWQMFAVAKLPRHSEKTANHLRRVILSQKDNDIYFYDTFPEAIPEMYLVKEYLTCLGYGLESFERS